MRAAAFLLASWAARRQQPVHIAANMRDEVSSAMSLLEEGDDVAFEERLLELRALDSRRMDMPPALVDGFVRLFEFRRDRDPLAVEPCDALAALNADREAWDEVAKACGQARDRSEATSTAPAKDMWRRALGLRARRSTWDWLLEDEDEARSLCEADGVGPFHALSLPGLSPQQRRNRGRRALREAASRVTNGEKKSLVSSRRRAGGGDRDDRLPLVAVLTPDANGAHPLSQLLPTALGSVRRYRIGLVTMCAPDGSAERERFEAAADVVVDAHESSPESVAGAIESLNPVALVDMCGFAGSSDVLDVVARRPAPVIIQGGLGTPSLMGSELYDYAICDRTVVPTSADGMERPLHMPFTYFVADPAAYAAAEKAEGPTRESVGLQDGAVVLCCMNRAHKVEPELFDVWIGAVIDLVTDGIDVQLWLYAPSEPAKERAIARAAAAFADTEDTDGARRHLVFADRAPRATHLRRLTCADIALDTRPYGSHTLACDYAYAGVPLVTSLADETWQSRVGAAVGYAAVLEEDERLLVREACLADDWTEDYRRKVVDLAKEPRRRTRLRRAFREGRDGAPLWNPSRWAAGFENALDACRNPIVGKTIVLGSDKRRVTHFEGHVAVALPEIERFDAVEGRDGVRLAFNDLDLDKVSPVFSEATVGQIACACSHALVWKGIAEDATLLDDDVVLVLEDDASFPRGSEAFRKAVRDVSNDPFDLCYVYVYPDHWPSPPRINSTTVQTVPGFRTWCLVSYLVSKKGAKTLLDLLRHDLHGEIYAPIDCVVSDFFARGLLDVRAVDTVGFVDSAGQLDKRRPGPDKLPSNLWTSPRWFSAVNEEKSLN